MDLGLNPPGLGRASVLIVPDEVSQDRRVLLGVGPIVGAVEGERAERLELALDEVEPARVGRQEHHLDVVFRRPCAELGLAMRAPVVEYDDKVLTEGAWTSSSRSWVSRHVLWSRKWPIIVPADGS